MSNKQRNLDQLASAAKLLGPLVEELVFVGGCTTALLITEEGAADVRPTKDVDAIAELSTYADYAKLSARLRRAGFKEDQREGAPMCRWCSGDVVLDVMPNDEKVLGFANRWYTDVLKTATPLHLERGASQSE
jgi:hypothetical protein